MAAIIYRQPGERWVPDINASPDPKQGGGPMLNDPDGLRRRFFGEWGHRFQPEEIRTEFWLRSRHKTLADTFSVCGKWGVSAEFRAAVTGRHLWHSKTDGVSGHFFISDALRDLFVARKLQGFVIRPVAEA
jgi:hypothetical protein